jgi:hypothetical protein
MKVDASSFYDSFCFFGFFGFIGFVVKEQGNEIRGQKAGENYGGL